MQNLVVRGWLYFVAVLALGTASACGGGGSGGGANTGGDNPRAGIAMQGMWIGTASGIGENAVGAGAGANYSDLQLEGSAINKLFVDYGSQSRDNPYPQVISVSKVTQFLGYNYLSTDGNFLFAFCNEGNHAGMINGLINGIGVYQHNSITAATPKRAEDIDGRWAGSFFFKSNRDGLLYQKPVSVSCKSEICTFEQDGFSIDFKNAYFSGFFPDGTWYGTETNSGTRKYSTAIMSGDAQFIVMSLCWYTHTISGEGVFDICEASVLAKVPAGVGRTAISEVGEPPETVDGGAEGLDLQTGRGSL
ncbi:MAG: hypothetical protein HZB55_24355 [Deltaproteobacteria bacterium]|nr:hypothetical protein [Deltaproteobacteria bacterium]